MHVTFESVGEGDLVVLGARIVPAVGVGEVDERAHLSGPLFEADADGQVDELLLHRHDDVTHPRVGQPAQQRGVGERDPTRGQCVADDPERGAQRASDGDLPVCVTARQAELRTQPTRGLQPGTATGLVASVQFGEHHRAHRIERALGQLQRTHRTHELIISSATEVRSGATSKG